MIIGTTHEEEYGYTKQLCIINNRLYINIKYTNNNHAKENHIVDRIEIYTPINYYKTKVYCNDGTYWGLDFIFIN